MILHYISREFNGGFKCFFFSKLRIMDTKVRGPINYRYIPALPLFDCDVDEVWGVCFGCYVCVYVIVHLECITNLFVEF